MPKRIQFEGAVHTFPDDATDDEIRNVLSAGTRKSPYAITAPPPPPAGPNVKMQELDPVARFSLRAFTDAPEVAKGLLTPPQVAPFIPESITRPETAPIVQQARKGIKETKEFFETGKTPPLPPTAEVLGQAAGVDVGAVKENTAAYDSVINPENAYEAVKTALMWIGGGRLLGTSPSKVRAEATPTRAVEQLSFATGKHAEVPAALTKALPELVKTARSLKERPNTLRSFDEIVGQTQQRLHQTFTDILNEPVKAPGGKTIPLGLLEVDGNPIAQAILRQATSAVRKADPSLYKALQDEAVVYKQGYTLAELNELRMSKNADLASYYNKAAAERATDIKKSQAARKADVAAVDAIRDLQYDTMERMSPTARKLGLRDLKANEQALLNIRSSLGDRIDALAAAVPYERGTPAMHRLSSGSLYTDPMSPLSGGVRVGHIMDMFIPAAVREEYWAGRAVSNALGRGKPSYTKAAPIAASQQRERETPTTRELSRLGLAAAIPPNAEETVRVFIGSPRYRDWDDDERRTQLRELLNGIRRSAGRNAKAPAPPPP